MTLTILQKGVYTAVVVGRGCSQLAGFTAISCTHKLWGLSLYDGNDPRTLTAGSRRSLSALVYARAEYGAGPELVWLSVDSCPCYFMWV